MNNKNEKLSKNLLYEIMDKNKFKDKFNLNSDTPINDIAKNTATFIEENNMNSLIPLAKTLRSYYIPLEMYFNFIDSILNVDFNDYKYREVIISEYSEIFKAIDNTNISDLDNIKFKVELLNSMEKNRQKNERRNAITKVVMFTTGVAALTTTAVVVSKIKIADLETKKDIAKLAYKSQNIKNICEVCTKAIEIPLSIIKFRQ